MRHKYTKDNYDISTRYWLVYIACGNCAMKPVTNYLNSKTNAMKQSSKEKNKTASSLKGICEKLAVKHLELLLPPGVRFDDIYMDAQQVTQELHISKRVVRNIRVSGRISYTNPFGKIFYYRQEIAAIMEANKKSKK